jgi:hypothetical protein
VTAVVPAGTKTLEGSDKSTELSLVMAIFTPPNGAGAVKYTIAVEVPRLYVGLT